MGITGIEAVTGEVSKPLVSAVDYNEFGQMTRISRGNGTVTYYDYDIKGRLYNLVSTTGANGIIRRLQDVRYTFRIDNSIKSIENRPDIDTNGSNSSIIRYDYEYDGLNRLVHAEGHYEKTALSGNGVLLENKNFRRGYSYSQNGNLTAKRIYDTETGTISDNRTYTYSNHMVTRIGTTKHGSSRFEMIYDAAGNMISQRDNENAIAKEMEYDSYNRIRKVTDPDSRTESVIGQYWYDDQGFRVRKVAKRNIHGRDVNIEVLYPSMYFGIERQLNNGGNVIRETTYAVNNIYMNGVRIAAMLPNGNTRYYLTDQVDSVKVITDDDGLAISRMEYLPYGETWFQENREGLEEEHNPKFDSQELDKETNFYYYNARHYDPELCRFVTADNVIDGEYDTQGWNRFSYVKGNPIVYKDPTGHEAYGDDGNWAGIDSSGDQGVIESGVNSGDKSSAKKSVENGLQKAKGKANRFSEGNISPSGNGVIKQIIEYKPSGKYPNDHAGKVYITETKEEPNTKFWKQFRGKLEHWYKKGVLSKEKSLTMFDIGKNKHRKGKSDYYGPAKKFKIKRAGLSKGYGGRVDIELSDGTIVTLGHFTEINSKVMKASKSGEYLPAGTYLGETFQKIGSSSGPHVHGQGKNLIPLHRDKTLDKLINDENKK